MAGVLSLPRFQRDLMKRITIGPRLARALRALPGSIVTPRSCRSPPRPRSPAFIGIGAAIAVMIAHPAMEIAAIAAGLVASHWHAALGRKAILSRAQTGMRRRSANCASVLRRVGPVSGSSSFSRITAPTSVRRGEQHGLDRAH